MTLTTPNLKGADAWLDRAEEHLAGLQGLCKALAESACDDMIASRRFDAPDRAWGLTKPTGDPPALAGVLTGETIQALRRSLDYLVYELAWLDSGSEQEDTQFPIDAKEMVFDARRARKSSRDHSCFLVGVNDVHADAIQGLQPFTGTTWTKTLQALSNPDKHRHLTVAKHQASVNVARWSHPKNPANSEVVRISRDAFDVLWSVPDSPDLLRIELHVTAHVAIDEEHHLIDTLETLKVEVAHVLEDFRPCFSSRCQHTK